MTAADEQLLRQRLEELGVRSTPEELQELASVYPALVAWMRMVEELARDEDAALPE